MLLNMGIVGKLWNFGDGRVQTEHSCLCVCLWLVSVFEDVPMHIVPLKDSMKWYCITHTKQLLSTLTDFRYSVYMVELRSWEENVKFEVNVKFLP